MELDEVKSDGDSKVAAVHKESATKIAAMKDRGKKEIVDSKAEGDMKLDVVLMKTVSTHIEAPRKLEKAKKKTCSVLSKAEKKLDRSCKASKSALARQKVS